MQCLAEDAAPPEGGEWAHVTPAAEVAVSLAGERADTRSGGPGRAQPPVGWRRLVWNWRQTGAATADPAAALGPARRDGCPATAAPYATGGEPPPPRTHPARPARANRIPGNGCTMRTGAKPTAAMNTPVPPASVLGPARRGRLPGNGRTVRNRRQTAAATNPPHSPPGPPRADRPLNRAGPAAQPRSSARGVGEPALELLAPAVGERAPQP
ncbi:hypothetical protein GCM10017786_54410 [Amycolatopsis deserti]|uniref:Uncharacterized protein n=1 Tax=Amycolatopsis deserti TaxID=185696 RepID=A0ABQ3JAI7_9PSEU|nr:hypothetical protein GCM10017786_54410 [Amycolatopsis deserti]